MLLSAARSRVLRLVDDVDGDKYNGDGLFTEVDDALGIGQLEAFQHALVGGSNVFAQETSVTTSSDGVADLTTLKPALILNVSIAFGNGRLNVPAARFDGAPQNYPGVQSLKLYYVPRPVFPAASGNAFVWGHTNVTSTNLLDQLMCVIAARDLKANENEVNQVLERRMAELIEAVKGSFSPGGWAALPMDSWGAPRRNSGIRYLLTAPDTLQLVL